MATPRINVQAPAATPSPFGLFSVATMPLDTDEHFIGGGVQYEPDSCTTVLETGPACTVDPGDLSPSDGIGLVTGDPFVVYTLFTCRAPGSFDRGAERARTALQLGEQRGAEAAMVRILRSQPGGIEAGPGTPIHPVDGLAALEQYAAQMYGGTPTVHMSRMLGTVLTTHGSVIRAGTQLQTVQGALVASYGGANIAGGFTSLLEDPQDPVSYRSAAPGTEFMYITGQVTLHRSRTIEVAPTLALSPATNQFSALAERAYAATVECLTVAVLVSTSYYDTVAVAG